MKCDGIDLQGSIHSDTVKGVSSGSTTFEFDRPGLIDPRFFPHKVYVNPPGGDQAQPACFGAGQVLIPERSEHDRLCSTCMSLGRLNSTHWEDINNFREVTVNHPHSIDALITSAREGCHLCGLLLTALEEEIRLSQEPRGGWIFEAGTNSGALTGIIRLRFQRDEPTLPWDGFVFDGVRIVLLCGGLPGGEGGRLICQAMDTNHLTLPKACLPSGSDTDTGSSASLSRIKAWLNICRSSHPACFQVVSQPPPLPTRVISVGIKGSSECYLVFGDKASGYYATLSHCWGDPQNRPLSTTDRTLPCRQRGIKDEELPKTFRDAVHVCREIGIEYIWIDSLCIIQEQETQEDWAKEAPKMGQVYGNSILNISAAAAADSTEGCFRKRLGLSSWPCPVVLFGQTCYLFRYPNRREISGDPGDLAEGVWNVLGQRAWVLQEQILSRRSIIFSKHRLIWRCPTLSTNEKYPFGMPHAPDISFDNYRFLYCILNGITSSGTRESKVYNYRCWYKIVEEFTSRNLTYEEDRLPAIAGIAKRFGKAVDDSYHAGLWRRDMMSGLLWRAKPSKHSMCANKTDRTPSWSWASINGGVSYCDILPLDANASRILLSPLADILDVSDPTTCEDHPFGVTSRASLSLSGVLLAMMQVEQESFGLVTVISGSISEPDDEEFFSDFGKFGRSDQAPLVCLPVCVRHGAYDQDDDGELDKASWKRSLETGADDFEVFNTLLCLVLQAVEGRQGTYSRVGVGQVSGPKMIEVSRKAIFGERRSITLI